MRVLTPIMVTDAMLTSTNIPENDYSEWAVGTTYARGDYCISTNTHTIYRSLQDGNTGNDPDAEQAAIADPLIDNPSPIQWQVISATNRWKMFNVKPSVGSSLADSIVVDITPGQFIGGMAGFEITATEVTIEGFDPVSGGPDELIYTKTIDLLAGSEVGDWYDYYFTPILALTDFVVDDIPPYANAYWRVTITNTGGTAHIGDLVIGNMFMMGDVVMPGTGFSILDFSYVQNDEFGNLTRVVREATRLADFEIITPTTGIRWVEERLLALRGGKAAVWIGDDRPGVRAVIYGFIRDASVVYTSGSQSIVSLRIQGIV